MAENAEKMTKKRPPRVKEEEELKMECQCCDEKDDPKVIRKHQEREHQDELDFCYLCEMTYMKTSSGGLRGHLKRYHFNGDTANPNFESGWAKYKKLRKKGSIPIFDIEKPTEEQEFCEPPTSADRPPRFDDQCPRCDVRGPQTVLRTHQEEDHDLREIEFCYKCEHTFPRLDYLKEHITREHFGGDKTNPEFIATWDDHRKMRRVGTIPIYDVDRPGEQQEYRPAKCITSRDSYELEANLSTEQLQEAGLILESPSGNSSSRAPSSMNMGASENQGQPSGPQMHNFEPETDPDVPGPSTSQRQHEQNPETFNFNSQQFFQQFDDERLDYQQPSQFLEQQQLDSAGTSGYNYAPLQQNFYGPGYDHSYYYTEGPSSSNSTAFVDTPMQYPPSNFPTTDSQYEPYFGPDATQYQSSASGDRGSLGTGDQFGNTTTQSDPTYDDPEESSSSEPTKKRRKR